MRTIIQGGIGKLYIVVTIIKRDIVFEFITNGLMNIENLCGCYMPHCESNVHLQSSRWK